MVPTGICVDECDENIFHINGNNCGFCKDINSTHPYKLLNETGCYENITEGTFLYNSKYYLLKRNSEISTIYNFFADTSVQSTLNEINNNDYILDLNTKNNQNSSIIDENINNIRNIIINGNINLSYIVNGSESYFLKQYNNITYLISTSDNLKNITKNISTINLGECENTLKYIYNISTNLSLIIFKVDYYKNNSLIPIIGYEVFDPITQKQLNLSFCDNTTINLSIPVSIDENDLEKYDPNSDYYTDQCYTSKSEYGTDILLNDRYVEYNDNNMALCENNCTLADYNSDTKQVVCECEVKYEQIVVSDISNKSDILYNNFNNKDLSTNMVTMKCFYTLFTKEGMINNIENYILLFIILLFIIFAILFYKFGYPGLEMIITEIIQYKTDKENNVIETVDFAVNKENKIHNKKNNNDKIKIDKLDNKHNKGNIKRKLNKSQNSKNNLNKSHNKSKLKLKQNISKNELLNSKKVKKLKINNSNENYFCDYELNSLNYKEALKKDKRSFLNYYAYLIKTKNLLLFTFFPINNYNSRIVKLSLFLISFSIYNFTNALFFNESTIHKIYEEGGIYNFIYLIPFILYSFIISHTLVSIINYFSLSEKNIYEIKKEKNINNINDIEEKVKKCLVIKYILLYIIGTVVLFFIWYYLSSFGAVYQNTQKYLIKNTLICLGFSLIYSFIINLLPGALRLYALKNKKREMEYKISRVMQFI